MGYVIRRCSFRRCKTGVYDDYRHFGAGIACIVSHWSDNQYFSDGDIHTGTDTYIYTEDHRSVCRNDLMRFLDVESVVRFHGKAVE